MDLSISFRLCRSCQMRLMRCFQFTIARLLDFIPKTSRSTIGAHHRPGPPCITHIVEHLAHLPWIVIDKTFGYVSYGWSIERSWEIIITLVIERLVEITIEGYFWRWSHLTCWHSISFIAMGIQDTALMKPSAH